MLKKLKKSILTLKLKYKYQTQILKSIIKKYNKKSNSIKIFEDKYSMNIFRYFTKSYKKQFFFRYLTKKIIIRIKSNNVFCTLVHLHKKRLLLYYSAGVSKIRISKKTLRYNSRLLIKKFITLLIKKIRRKNSFLFLEILGPIRIRKSILKQISFSLRHFQKLLILVKPKKCFNGCRVKKKRRKKYKGFKILK